MPSTSVQFESLSRGCGSSLRAKHSVRSSNRRVLPKDGPRKALVAFLIDKGVATWSLMWMRRVKQRGNERCPVALNFLLLDADLMLFALRVIKDASEAR